MRDAASDGRDARHYLRLIWRWKWLLLAVLLLIPAAVYAVSRQLPETYEAETTLQVQQTTVPSAVFGGTGASTSSLEGTARLIETTAVARQAARIAGLPPREAGSLLGDVSVSTVAATTEANQEFLTIIVEADAARKAARIANAFARAVADTRTEDAIGQINGTIRVLAAEAEANEELDSATAKEVADQLQQLRALRASQASATHVIEPAFPPGSPVSPRPLRNTAIGLVLSILIAAGLIPLLDRLDRKLREPEEAEALTGAPTLAQIPEEAFPGHGDSPGARESFQTLRATLTYFNIDKPLETIMVTSPGNAEGKTTVATNLAMAMAQDGRDVILIDGDLRRPQAITRFALNPGIGLDAVLLGDSDVDQALLEVGVEGSGRLRILPGGQGAPNGAVLLGSERMRDLLRALAGKSEVVVLDTPPLLVVSDAIPMLDAVSGVVLVARQDQSSVDSVKRAKRVIASAKGTLLGVAVTGTRSAGLYDYYTRPPSEKRGFMPFGRDNAGSGANPNGAGESESVVEAE